MPSDWKDVNRQFDERGPEGHDPFRQNSIGWHYDRIPDAAQIRQRLKEERAKTRQALTPHQKRMLRRKG